MGRYSTFPTLFDSALQINISELKNWGYLEKNKIKSGTLTWNRNGTKTGSISIISNTLNDSPYIELDYKFNEEPRNYKVLIVSTPSNLGKGFIWYFRCPKTRKKCRKLYSISGYFYHREAFKNVLYESQTQGKKYRLLDKTFGGYFKSDDLYSELYKKSFKKTYAGKPTKRYLKIMRELKKSEHITFTDIKGMLFK